MPSPEPLAHGRSFVVVGVGASAGGLSALKELFSHLPPGVHAAFVVVTHQHPDHQSLLPELIRRSTELTVTEAGDGEVIRPGHLYVAPPGGTLAMMNGTLHRMAAHERAASMHPIDSFFRALAHDCRERAIGVVLSGTGSDGTLGLAAIKGEGGITMAEDLRSASYTGMPENAIQSGNVDHVLPAAGLARQIAAYATSQPAEPVDTTAMIKDEKKLLVLLRARTGHDFTHYKKNTVRRRIERRLHVHHIPDTATYLRYLQENPAEIDALYKELLIGVTSFFRDPDTFEALAGVLGKLVASCPDEQPVRVWVPGCSTGEEAYSIAILLREAMERAKKRIAVRLFATDVDAEAIDQARTGVYPAVIAADVGAERLQRFFVHEDGM